MGKDDIGALVGTSDGGDVGAGVAGDAVGPGEGGDVLEQQVCGHCDATSLSTAHRLCSVAQLRLLSVPQVGVGVGIALGRAVGAKLGNGVGMPVGDSDG